MSELSHAPGSWSLVTFTGEESALAELAGLRPRFSGMRFVAVVPALMVAPADIAVLVDTDSRLATQLGIRDTTSWMVDGRGTVAHRWEGVPEAEAVAVYAARSPMPSGAPAWLFPVLAAAVLIVGIGAWASTRPAEVPAPPLAVAAAPAPAPTPAPAPPVEEATPGDAAGGEATADAEATPEAGPPGGAPGKKGKWTPPGRIGDWQITPKEQAAQGSLDGDVLTLKSSPDKAISACHAPVPLSGLKKVAGEWKLAGVSGKGAKLSVREIGADSKPVKDKDAWTVAARGKGTVDWKAFSTDVPVAAGATQARVCLELDAGGGSVSVRKLGL